jgi:hypothetical protein
MLQLLRFFYILLFASTIFAQSKIVSRCEMNKAPALRDFTIGESVENINLVIPNFKLAYNKSKREAGMRDGSDGQLGFVMLSSTDVFYQEDGNQLKKIVPDEKFSDVNFMWHFLDDKLSFIAVDYDEFDPPNIKDFVHQVAEKTRLPLKGWVFKDKYTAVLKCVGFNVDVWMGKYVDRPLYKVSPTVMITDTMADAELNKRRKEMVQRKKTEERERLRREKERKAVFKP